MAVLYAGNVTAQQTAPLLNIALRQSLVLPQNLQPFTDHHG
jgi:hypothetical protein